eukprot:scaffold13737_cov66-Phaeocystis_antarctica.AAC.1
MPVIGTSVLICVVNLYFVVWLVPLAGVFLLLRSYAAGAQRDLQRLESVSRSPIFTAFGEALNGLPTIRAFSSEGRFEANNARLVDLNTNPNPNPDPNPDPNPNQAGRPQHALLLRAVPRKSVGLDPAGRAGRPGHSRGDAAPRDLDAHRRARLPRACGPRHLQP